MKGIHQKKSRERGGSAMRAECLLHNQWITMKGIFWFAAGSIFPIKPQSEFAKKSKKRDAAATGGCPPLPCSERFIPRAGHDLLLSVG
jgi:hypothetical protein